MSISTKKLLIGAALLAMGGLLASSPADAGGRRGAGVYNAQRVAPARAAPTRVLAKRSASRAQARPVVRGQPTRVAGFEQRAAPRRSVAASVRTATRSANGDGAGSTSINGYRDLSFSTFRTGDFFDHPQQNNR